MDAPRSPRWSQTLTRARHRSRRLSSTSGPGRFVRQVCGSSLISSRRRIRSPMTDDRRVMQSSRWEPGTIIHKEKLTIPSDGFASLALCAGKIERLPRSPAIHLRAQNPNAIMKPNNGYQNRKESSEGEMIDPARPYEESWIAAFASTSRAAVQRPDRRGWRGGPAGTPPSVRRPETARPPRRTSGDREG